jgi:hypothetical protein
MTKLADSSSPPRLAVWLAENGSGSMLSTVFDYWRTSRFSDSGDVLAGALFNRVEDSVDSPVVEHREERFRLAVVPELAGASRR